MQSFINIASTDTLTNSRQELLNNDMTILSCSAGTSFPTTNLQQGMFCLRTDLGTAGQLYQLKDMTPTWKLIFDLAKTAVFQEYVDQQDATRVNLTSVVTVPTANKILQLDSNGNLPTNITGSAASAAAVAWANITGIPSTFTPPIATAAALGGVKIGSGVTVASDGTISVATQSVVPHGKQIFTSSGTFSVPTGVTQVWVSLCGGGGGGASGSGGSSGYSGGAGGGGGGADSKLAYSVNGLTSGANITVTVGTGGAAGAAGSASSFGSYVSCSGGGAGVAGSSTGAGGATGGSGGSAGSGGGSMSNGQGSGGPGPSGGSGGAGLWGAGGGGGYGGNASSSGGPGTAGGGYGAGGGGGGGGGSAGGSTGGGGGAAGSAGMVLVEW